jgi:hypothetical protein
MNFVQKCDHVKVRVLLPSSATSNLELWYTCTRRSRVEYKVNLCPPSVALAIRTVPLFRLARPRSSGLFTRTLLVPGGRVRIFQQIVKKKKGEPSGSRTHTVSHHSKNI